MSSAFHDQLSALRDKVEDVKFGMFTTTNPDLSLSSRPMTSQQIDTQGQLWFFTSDESAFVKNLAAQPLVNVTFAKPDDSLYVSISGRAMLIKNREKAEELWNPMVGAWFPGGLDDPHLALINVDIHDAEYWDVASSKMTQLLAMAKGVFTGKRPTDLGEHVEIKL
jgi:general stress protein 26